MSCILKSKHRRQVALAVAFAAICLATTPVRAQFGGFRNAAVGGVKIDTEGVVSNPQVGELKQLQSAWQKGLQQVPADLGKWTDLRFVSLKQLETEITSARSAGKPNARRGSRGTRS